MNDQLKPNNAEYATAVVASFLRQPAMKEIGITIIDVKPGFVELEMPFDRRFTQQHGFIHAGIMTTALDTACGYAAFSLMPSDAAVLTVEFKTNLIAPAAGESFRFRGQVVKSGRTLSVCDGQAFAYHEGRGKLVASMSATMMAVFQRTGIHN